MENKCMGRKSSLKLPCNLLNILNKLKIILSFKNKTEAKLKLQLFVKNIWCTVLKIIIDTHKNCYILRITIFIYIIYVYIRIACKK